MRRFINVISEAPLLDIQHLGDWSDEETDTSADLAFGGGHRGNNSFAGKRDRRMATSPVILDSLTKKLETFRYDFVLYFLNDKEIAKPFFQTIDWGVLDLSNAPVDLDLKTQLADSVKKTPGAIHVLLTHNEGGKIRHPLTPWLIVHRMCHAMMGNYSGEGDLWTDQLTGIVNKFATQLCGLSDQEHYSYSGGGDHDRAELVGAYVGRAFNFASSRNNKILKVESDDEYFELWVEAFTQYVLRGEVRILPIPSATVDANGMTYTIKNMTMAQRCFAEFVENLEEFFDKRLAASVGRVNAC